MRLAQQAVRPPPSPAAGYSPLLAATLSKKNRKVWYPASGVRDRGTGAMAAVGNSGYSWASTVSGVNACFLYFNSSLIYPSYAYHRANGFQVRCLREWQPVGRKRNCGAAQCAAPQFVFAALRAA